MSDVFSLLSSGARFNKQRFVNDLQAFQPASRLAPSAPELSAASVILTPPQDGGAPPAGTSRRAKKKAKQSALKAETQEVIDVAVFGKRSAAAAGADVDGAASSSGDEEDGDEDGARRRRSSGADGQPSTSAAATAAAFKDAACPALATRDPAEEANVLRKTYRIRCAGTDVPDPLRSFAQLAVLASGRRRRGAARVLERLVESGFLEPTPVQRQAIPALLAGRELLAVAPTGSGKTLAFLAPILLALQAQKSSGDWPDAPKAVVLSPTAELAAQQARVLKLLLPGCGLRGRLLSKATATGSDFSKVDILLANPLRLANLAGPGGKLDLTQVRWLVLDEADKLFELGFMEQLDSVLAATTHPRLVRALFSATLPEKVEDLARSVLQQPLRITVGVRNAAVDSVKQRLVFAGREAGKLLAMRQLISSGLTPPVLCFVGSKDRARELHRELMYDGVHVDSITAEQSAAARTAAVDNFRSGRTWLLIATDLLGRGMDFAAVSTVINYDFPATSADYIHRVGRTGRAGRSGEAITFFTEDDADKLRTVANIIKASGGEVAEWMLALKKGRTGRVSSGGGRGGGGGGRGGGGKGKLGVRRPGAGPMSGAISTEPFQDREKRKRKRQSIEASKSKVAKAAA